MEALGFWTPLTGINGNKVYCQLSDVVLVEEHDVKNQSVSTLRTRYGTSFTVEHSVVEIMEKIEQDGKKTMEENLAFWKERSAKRIEAKEKRKLLEDVLPQKVIKTQQEQD